MEPESSHPWRAWLLLLSLTGAVAVAGCCAGPPTETAGAAAATLPATPPGAEERPRAKPKDRSRLSAELSALYAEYEAHRGEGSGAAFEPRNPALRVRDGAVLIDCTAAGDGAALRRSLEALGLVEGAVYGDAVSGWLPITDIPSLSQLKELGLARAAMSATGESPGD